MMPLIVAFVGYTFLALDAIVRDIEETSGLGSTALALNTLRHMTETTLLEMAGEEVPAAAVRPDRYPFD